MGAVGALPDILASYKQYFGYERNIWTRAEHLRKRRIYRVFLVHITPVGKMCILRYKFWFWRAVFDEEQASKKDSANGNVQGAAD